MPISLQRDIRAFFEKPSIAHDLAKQALFSIADTELVGLACENARGKLFCGRLLGNSYFTFYAPLLRDLPPILRIYIGCAAQLYGDLANTHLIKVHVDSSKVTFLHYDRFDGYLPTLKERVKVNLRNQTVNFFTYTNPNRRQPLLYKGDYLPPDSASVPLQSRFDDVIRSMGIEKPEYEITIADLRDAAIARGLADTTLLAILEEAETDRTIRSPRQDN